MKLRTLGIGLGLGLGLGLGVSAGSDLNLTDAQVDIVLQRLAQGATHSWEYGTRLQALLELSTPELSVLTQPNASTGSTISVPPPSTSPPSSLSTVLDVVATIIANRSQTISSQKLSEPQSFFPSDGAAGDPASVGVAALLANYTGQKNDSYDPLAAAQSQLQFLLEKVPRAENGAISHRVSEVQLWSDFVYMVPPFLTYYGVMSGNETLAGMGYDQIKAYREQLRDEKTGLWLHVVNGSDFHDYGLWSTGNGWAAAGMLRVLATLQNSEYRNKFKNQIEDLRKWTDEIQTGMYNHLRSDGLFNNYANDSSTFADAASAALVASTVYRIALLTNTYHHLPLAENVRRQLWAPADANSTTGGNVTSYVNASSLANMTYFSGPTFVLTNSSSSANSSSTSNGTASNGNSTSSMNGTLTESDSGEGWLTPVVNPDSFGQEGSQSPESEAFVVMMYAAWRDWDEAGAVGANAATRSIEVSWAAWAVVGMGVVVGMGAW